MKNSTEMIPGKIYVELLNNGEPTGCIPFFSP